jgi:hypothetical protein
MMVAFRPVHSDPAPGCYVELSRRMPYGFKLAANAVRPLEAIQSRLVFDIASEALAAETGYSIEKRLMGSDFSADERTRWWEKLGRDRLNLLHALRRRDPAAQMWMERLKRHTDSAERALSMPLWHLSRVGRATVFSVMSWRAAIEAMGVAIPRFPNRSPDDAKRYVTALQELLFRRDSQWEAINAAIYSLRLAEAQGNLPSYVLTYETMLSNEWPLLQDSNSIGNAWARLADFYTDWFSTLQLNVVDEAEFIGVADELTAYGLHVKVASIPRDRDERYALADMLVPGTRGSSSPSNFIFARIDRHKLSAWPMCS